MLVSKATKLLKLGHSDFDQVYAMVRLGRVCGWASESGRLWANTLTAVPLRPCVPTAASTHWATAQCPLIMIGRRLSRGCSSGCGLQSRCRCTARLQHSGSESQVPCSGPLGARQCRHRGPAKLVPSH